MIDTAMEEHTELTWESCKQVFEWDGSLCDIYVLDTDEADWQTLLTFLAAIPNKVEWIVGGVTTTAPGDAAEVFAHNAEARTVLRIEVNGLVLMCHFFCKEQIEFDLDPREMSKERFSSLLQFMQSVGERIGKSIHLAPEGMKNRPCFRFDTEHGAWEWMLPQ